VPYIQQCWREIGVEAIPTALPFPTQLEELDAGEGEAAMMQFSWNPDGFQGSMFYCDSTPPNGFNWIGWCNEEYEALDEQAMSDLDDERQYELLRGAANVINDDAAVGVLTSSRGVAGAQSRVKNFHPLGLSVGWWIRYTWIEDEA
jgi:ABC-type transport system substrate-binding protein